MNIKIDFKIPRSFTRMRPLINTTRSFFAVTFLQGCTQVSSEWSSDTLPSRAVSELLHISLCFRSSAGDFPTASDLLKKQIFKANRQFFLQIFAPKRKMLYDSLEFSVLRPWRRNFEKVCLCCPLLPATGSGTGRKGKDAALETAAVMSSFVCEPKSAYARLSSDHPFAFLLTVLTLNQRQCFLKQNQSSNTKNYQSPFLLWGGS